MFCSEIKDKAIELGALTTIIFYIKLSSWCWAGRDPVVYYVPPDYNFILS